MKYGVTIECFPCSGGMAEGFRRAGVVFDYAFDKDPNACDSYEKNHGHRPVQMDVRDLLRLVRGGWTPGPVRLFVADPPCTPWSRAGKRKGREDERDMLDDTVEIIALLRPEAYLIGNVPGLDDSTQWHVVQDALGVLARAGYCVADYVKLDAADYGVPQHRVRPFWFGHLTGPCVRWPSPTHGPRAHSLHIPGCELHPHVTCRDALSHLPVEDLGKPLHQRWNKKHLPSDAHRPSKTITTGGARQQCNSVRPWHNPHPPSEPDRPARSITTRSRAGHGGGGGVLIAGQGQSRADEPAHTITTQCRAAGHATTLDWPWDRPSTTVTCRAGLPPPGDVECYAVSAAALAVARITAESCARGSASEPLGYYGHTRTDAQVEHDV